MNICTFFTHNIFVNARVLVLGCCSILLAACNSAPIQNTQSNVTDTVHENAVTGVAAVNSSTVTPDKGQPMPFRDEFNAGAPEAGEEAAIRRMMPGAEPRAALRNYIETLPTASERPIRSFAKVLFIGEAAYEQVFPGRLFYVVRFPQWPVAVEPPAPLVSNNLFVFESGKLRQLITSSQQLQQYFSQAATARGGKDAAKYMLEAWLSLYAELAQDGLFQFGAPKIDSVNKTASDAVEAKGRISVEPRNGDSGEITARITIDANGNLLSAHTEQSLQSGIRPICQATKLLDPDPLVRRMAERDLLVMGRLARDYLFQQRSKASPALQARIDRLWRQILEEKR